MSATRRTGRRSRKETSRPSAKSNRATPISAAAVRSISNGRLLSAEQGRVRFRCRGSRRGPRTKTVALDGVEFLRRFLLHVLPRGFVRIRSFGLLAHRHRSTALATCRQPLAATQPQENLGYKVMHLNEGLAVVYAELEQASFTGMGISFGGGMCNVCISYLGMPALTFCTARAGDYIDRSTASVTSETPTSVRLYKERGFTLNGLSQKGEILSNVVDGAGQAARCSISSPSLNFFPSKTWTISSEPLSLRQRTSA